MHDILWVLSKVRNMAEQQNLEVFLVGGFVRDLYLNEYSRDIDLLLNGPCLEFSQQLARETEGSFVPLSPEHNVYRVMVKRLGIQIDITSPVDGQFTRDLFARDFTCNAIALNVKDYLEERTWWEKALDPTKGLEDLGRRKLRPVTRDSFVKDPVRIFRGLRLAAELGLDLVPEYETLAKKAAPLLQKVAGERIKQELWLLFKQEEAYRYVRLLDQWRVLDQVFPELTKLRETEQNFHHGENAWAHSLRVLETMEKEDLGYLPGRIRDAAREYLSQQLTVAGTRWQLLKFAALFHDIGKIDTSRKMENGRITFHGHDRAGVKYGERYAGYLGFSRRERNSLVNVIKLHMRPLALFVDDKMTDRAVYRLLKDAGEEMGMLLLLSYADIMATRQASGRNLEQSFREFLLTLWKRYLEFRSEEKPLVTGQELLVELGLQPGPIIGELLDGIEEARLSGRVKNKQQAFARAKELLREYGYNNGIGEE